MKFSIVLLGVVFCLGAPAPGQTTNQSAKTTQIAANRMKPPASTASQPQQSLIGCVDERDGHYVLRDDQTGQLLSLQAPGSNDDTWFAKYLGHKAQVSGPKSSGTLSVTSVKQVADMCGPAK